jgi:hypothetical protein
MDKDKQLSSQIEQYQQVAKENPNVDIGLLMMNALQNQKENSVSPKAKRWAYLISIGVPPFGFFWALKYFWSDQDDAKDVAWTCIVLTIISVIMFWVGGSLLLSGSGTSLQQIQQIKPSDIQQGFQ